MRIQLDMFAVELGASILMQFETADGRVTVLADAGEAKHNVNDRLPSAFADFQDGDDLRIDLMIGTHYDSDHLAGLVDVIKNPRISIGEAWLPPVANDAEPHQGNALNDSNLLALQFARPDGQAVLEQYIKSKARLCDQLASLERAGDEHLTIQREVSISKGDVNFRLLADRPLYADTLSDYEGLFRAHIDDANLTLRATGAGHADEPIADPYQVTEQFAAARATDSHFSAMVRPTADINEMTAEWSTNPSRVPIEAPTLALIRKSAANEAITATHLAKVVQALKQRNIPMRCAIIPDGKPRRFYWNNASRRFTPLKTRGDGGPQLLLLGPSEGLVEKFRDKLPIGTYAYMATRALLPIKPITPSNQLSYIMAFEYADQRLLITGDAGCVDFAPASKAPYHADLIEALSPFNVVQVAHHGGYNAHFYRCLQAAQFPQGEPLSYLLLSHAIHDKSRPSDVFNRFVTESGKTESEIQILFTSEPQDANVRDLKPLVAPTVGTKDDAGDVRLVFDGEWKVARHAVAV